MRWSYEKCALVMLFSIIVFLCFCIYAMNNIVGDLNRLEKQLIVWNSLLNSLQGDPLKIHGTFRKLSS